ncbi:MAG: hypothetical protein JST12_03850 [Armatimonadetes bacterium]|nr:hypothetical protein [Armatimonadota bacterium]
MMRGLLILPVLGLAGLAYCFDNSTPTTKLETNKGWFSGYFQVQYFATDRSGAQSGAFKVRREKLAYNYLADERTMGRFSVEFASGSNESTAQVREGYIQYRPNTFETKSGPAFTIGAQDTPIGYEVKYSSSNRKWPEQSAYEKAYFDGESGKGLLYQNGNEDNYWYVGLWDSLTVNDKEQANSSTAGEVGTIAGIRAKSGPWEGGISGLNGKRPAYSSGSTNLASTDRRFGYLDLRYHPAGSRFDVRSEYMVGKDRVPLAAVAAGTPTTGAHVNVDYMLNDSDTFVARYETFDRDKDTPGTTQTLYGAAYVRDVSKYLRLTLATDWNKNPNNPAGQTSYRTLTFRVQFKF